jgi:hypothetical protein
MEERRPWMEDLEVVELRGENVQLHSQVAELRAKVIDLEQRASGYRRATLLLRCRLDKMSEALRVIRTQTRRYL